mgnify:CR=1 FL=1
MQAPGACAAGAGAASGLVDQLAAEVLGSELQQERALAGLGDLLADILFILGEAAAELRGDVHDLLLVIQHPDAPEDDHAFHIQRPLPGVAVALIVGAEGDLVAFAQGFQPVASFNYQAKRVDRVKTGLLFTTAFGLVFIGAMSTISIIFAAPIISIFQKHPEVIAIGSKALRFTAIGMMFMPFSVPVNMLYQSIQQPTISSILSLIRSGMVTIPILLFGVPILGLLGIQIAQPTADIIAGLISIPFIIRFVRKAE